MHRRELTRLMLGGSLAVAAITAAADTAIRFDTDGGQSAPQELLIKDGKVLTEGDQQGATSVLFDTRQQVMTVIDHSDKQYTTMTQQELEQLGTDVNDAMAQARRQMEEQLKSLPPEQREQMRRMMEQRMPEAMRGGGSGDGEGAETTIEKTGSTREVAGHTCTVWSVHRGGRKVAEQCVIAHSELGMPAADYEALSALQAFARSTMEKLARFGGDVPQMGGMVSVEDGMVPIQVVTYDAGGQTQSAQLAGIDTGTLDAQRFSVPEGYSQQSMPRIGGDQAPR